MSNREAIALLRNLEDALDSYCELNEEGKTAFHMATTALSCSEFPNSSDTISRQDAVKTMYDLCEDIDRESLHIDVIVDALENLPSAEPRKKGKWIQPCDITGFGRCSSCNALWDNSLIENRYFRYCPRCGADMRGNSE